MYNNTLHNTQYTYQNFNAKYPCPTPLLMSEVLRAPWILQSALDDLSNDATSQSGLNHLHRTPKLVQIIQVRAKEKFCINTLHLHLRLVCQE